MSCCGPHFWLELQAFLTRRFKVKLKAVSSTAILVRWAEPSGDYSAPYKIRYRAAGQRMFQKVGVEPGQHSHLLTRLRPDTEYEVGIVDKSLPPDQQEYTRSKFVTTLASRHGRTVAEERRPLLGD